jgi:hypothetical protein
MRFFPRGAALAAATLMLSAACGSSGGGASPSPSATARGFAAYADCLREHGVDVPTARPSGRPSGGFFGGANAEARRACRSLAPQGRRPGLQQRQAYRGCLADHGVRLPSAAPGRSPGAGRFGRLNTADTTVAKAVRICRPLLPTFSPRPSPSPSPS